MRSLLAAACLVAGCTTVNTYPPISGGGGGTSGGGTHDAASDAGGDAGGDAGAMLAGRVCVLVDLRDLTRCATTGAAGLSVTLGASHATTTDDGSFTMPTPAGTNLVWQVTGSAIVPAAMPFGPVPTVPAARATDYADLQAGNGVIATTGQGAIMVRITRGGAALTGATASATPPPAYATFYAGTSTTQWNQGQTDATGTAWLPGIAAGQAVTLAIAAAGGTPSTTVPVTAPDGGIAFVTVDLAP